MNQLDAYFGKTMPDDERLTNYQAFALGSIRTLHVFLTRVKSYCELLEVELMENPIAETYLHENISALERAFSVLECLDGLTVQQDSSETYEPFDLIVLIKGIVQRLKQIHLAEITLPENQQEVQEAFIRGRFFLLQQALFELPYFFKSEKPISLHAFVKSGPLDDRLFQHPQAIPDATDFHLFTMSLSPQYPDLANLIGLTEKLIFAKHFDLDAKTLFVYGIILEHGGELLVNREPDSIQTLMIVLPKADNQTGMFTEHGVEKDHLQGDETILLVDDEGIIWDVVIDMLQELGYTVILAEHGKDCVEIYRENPGKIDLILLDMVMPEMNGREAFFALKKIDPDVKVLLQSGYIAQEDAQDVLDSGALGFLKKPYRMTELAKEIRQVLGKK